MAEAVAAHEDGHPRGLGVRIAGGALALACVGLAAASWLHFAGWRAARGRVATVLAETGTARRQPEVAREALRDPDPVRGTLAVARSLLADAFDYRSFASLPPLLTLERLLFRLIGAAFVLLTLTLATGIIFSESLFGRPLRFDHKSVFAVVSWLTFAALLVGRHFYGWRGRTALRWTLAGFVLLLLAYIGSRFVLEVVLGRGAT